MSEKKIKVGDRVRYIHPIPHYLRDYIGQGDECIVSEVTDCGYYVIKTCESLTIESDELELIEHRVSARIERVADQIQCRDWRRLPWMG